MLDIRDLVFLPILVGFMLVALALMVRTMRRSNQQTELLIEANRLLGELVALTRDRP
jgi:hypothetical protein